MSTGTEFDLRADCRFQQRRSGPNEIVQIIAGDRQETTATSATLRDAAGELEAQPNRSPAASARLGVCQYLLGRYSDASRRSPTATAARSPTSTWARRTSPSTSMPKRSRPTSRPRRPATTATTSRSPRPRRCATTATPQDALEVLDNLSGAVEQTAEYLYQRSATVAALGGNPDEVVALLGAGRRRRRQPRRRPVRPGPGERSPRQRRLRPRALRAGRRRSFPTHVGTLLNLGVLYEDMQHFEQGPAVLPADPRRLPDPRAGPAVLQGRRRLARHVLRRGSPPPPGSPQPGAQHSGHRLRALGPQPQLPAEDGHHDARRPDARRPSRNCSPARTSARRRSSKSARCCTSKGLELGQFADQSRRRRAGVRSRNALAPTSGRCSTGRLPT